MEPSDDAQSEFFLLNKFYLLWNTKESYKNCCGYAALNLSLQNYSNPGCIEFKGMLYSKRWLLCTSIHSILIVVWPGFQLIVIKPK